MRIIKNVIKTPDYFKLSAERKRRHLLSFVFNLFCYVILISIGYIVLYPFLYMVITSLRPPESYMDPTHNWIPSSISLENFKLALEFMDYGKSLINTLQFEMISAVLEILSCAVTAYGFARFKFKFKGIAMTVLFLTILIPSPMIIIPLVTNFSRLDFLGVLGLLNRLTGVDLRPNLMGTGLTYWLPSLLGVGLRSGILIYIYIQFFKGLPKELEEAAWIDGAGPIRTFFRIAVPSSSVVIITVAVFALVWHWNDYYMASMYSAGDGTLAVVAAQLPNTISAHNIQSEVIRKGCILAGSVMYVIPLLIVYMFLQRGFIESIDRVGITG